MKAILVIDMPKSCRDCKLTYLDTGDDAYFGVNVQRCIFDDAEADTDERYYDCPLKPLPEAKEIKPIPKGQTHYQWLKNKHEIIGWNNCLKEIDE